VPRKTPQLPVCEECQRRTPDVKFAGDLGRWICSHCWMSTIPAAYARSHHRKGECEGK